MEVGDKQEIGELLCKRGHVALLGRISAAEDLQRAQNLAEELATGPDSELGKAIAKLELAQAAFDAGKPLICGYAPEDITPGQTEWLRANRPEAIPPEVMSRLTANGTQRPEDPPSE